MIWLLTSCNREVFGKDAWREQSDIDGAAFEPVEDIAISSRRQLKLQLRGMRLSTAETLANGARTPVIFRRHDADNEERASRSGEPTDFAR